MSVDFVLRNDEKAVFALRALYGKYCYSQYKMSKFEEYDLYAGNKDFLVSESVITFTDTDGKLMALKPDVTLSIIKNNKDNAKSITKVFYDENVYRVSKGTKSYKEIMQAGLECLGDVDDFCINEVLTLAVKSLDSISKEFVLDVSSLDVIDGAMDDAKLSLAAKKEVLEFLSEKNLKGVKAVCIKEGVANSAAELLEKLVTAYGAPEKVENAICGCEFSENTKRAIDKLLCTVKTIKKVTGCDNINVDFSVVNDLNYYNGIVFKGFISGIPTGILSGGQYDNLMDKMGRKSRAIGFAVYLDELTRLSADDGVDADVAVIYGSTCAEKVSMVVEDLINSGNSVIALKSLPEKLKVKKVVNL